MSTRNAIFLASVVAASPASAWADRYDGMPCCTLDDDRPPCATDSTDVVGYRRCTPYGAWGSNLREPEVFMDIGMNVRHFAQAGGPLVVARRTEPITATERSDEAVMFDERIGVEMGRVLYLAFDFEFGDFASHDSQRASDRMLLVDGLVSLGLHGSIGPLLLRGEVAGGVMESTSVTQTDSSTDGVLEGRGRVDLWVTPWFTVGGTVGASLIHQGDWMAGLYVGFHTWSYAGDR
jgi:hypothetical protein